MRCVIARYPFDLTKDMVLAAMKGVTPEPIVGGSVTIGRRRYPLMQVGQVITRQDRRDFTPGEVRRAMVRLGFTCRATEDEVPASTARNPFERAAEALGGGAAPL